MAKKKPPEDENKARKFSDPNVLGLRAEVLEQGITDTLEVNFMTYAMSVIVSRAIPEIDGFKPSHRKLLYTMYKMGLLSGARTKSANIVGQTMHLNPHGDAAIYDTMVRLSRGNESLLVPFVDSEGNFGKVYSRDMAYAASRYTEAKLAPVCAELFRDIDRDTVDFIPNYDDSTTEPCLLPTTFPNILVSSNLGIAVGMASQICSFNLAEVCQTAIDCILDPEHNLLSTLPAPDFSTGGELIFDASDMAEIYRTGRGNFKLRSRWRFMEKENIIEVYEIPYTTTVEAIIDKAEELLKAGKLREISDMRDETDLNGLRLAIDLKRGTDPDKLMQKLFRLTPLMDTFSCNFNILVAGMPRVMGVREIIDEWTAWRTDCIKRRIFFDLTKKKERLHLLQGLKKILLDIDRAISIIRNTEEESEVVPNLMIGFGIDETQAEYIAEIKLRNINREFILKRVAETDSLENEIVSLEALLKNRLGIKKLIIDDLKTVMKKYGEPRKTAIVHAREIAVSEEAESEPDYETVFFLSREGYFKKITPLSLKMGGEQKYKEDDGPLAESAGKNSSELLFFTDRQQCYKAKGSDFADTKASALGDFLPAKLQMEQGESIVALVMAGDYSGSVIFAFENGRAARVPLSSYATKTNRRRLTGAYSGKSPLRTVLALSEETEVAVYSTEDRVIIFSTALLAPKASRDTQGVEIMKLKPKYRLRALRPADETGIQNRARYRVRSLPAAGALLKPEDAEEKQLSLDM